VKTSKNMKKYTAIIAAIAASALSFTAQATPLPLNGDLGFSGTPNIGSQTWPALTYVNVSAATLNASTSGSFAGLVGDTAAFNNPVQLSVASYGTPGTVMFTVYDAVNNDTYAFYDIATTYSAWQVPVNGQNQFLASGTGDVIEYAGSGGYNGIGSFGTEINSSGSGVWQIDVNHLGSAFSFDGVASVPDGGLTVTLLGAALVGLQAFRRKLSF
jgi:hypothetical protein